MIFGVILNTDETETEQIHREIRKLTAHYTDERMQFEMFRSSSQLLNWMKKTDLLDLAFVDISVHGGLDAAKKIRAFFPKTEILIIADVTVSPVKYLCPSIRPSALLLRPVNKKWNDAVKEFFLQFILSQKKKNDDEMLRIENRKGIFRIPFNKIYYLEAREKKVFIRMQIEELGVSETLEKMAEKMPSNFMRCHRSFIVNTDQIMQVSRNENVLYLKDGMIVPISRSYRKVFDRAR